MSGRRTEHGAAHGAGEPHQSLAERRAGRTAINDPELVLAAAARFLEARPRSIAETRRRLLAAGYPPELVHGAIDRLLDLGVLDDAAFARAWVGSRDRAHPRGERALQRELALKGIDRDIIAAVLAERETPVRSDTHEDTGETASADERAAERLLARKASALARIADPRGRRQRAYALLVRNGFDSGIAARVAERSLWTDDGAGN